MLDIRTAGIKPYIFNDNGVPHVTNNPTQKFYKELQGAREAGINSVDFIDTVMDFMLVREDRHYKSELPFDIKVLLMREYLEYHTKQLGAVFPGSNN